MVALAIAIPALALLYEQGVHALGSGRLAAAYQQAVSRAQSRLDSLSAGPLEPGEAQGDDGGGFRWRSTVRPIGSLAGRGGPGAALYAIRVELSWGGPDEPREVVLDTRRLGPTRGAPP